MLGGTWREKWSEGRKCSNLDSNRQPAEPSSELLGLNAAFLVSRVFCCCCFYMKQISVDDNTNFRAEIPIPPTLWLVEVLCVHRNRRLARDWSPGRPPRLSLSSRALMLLKCSFRSTETVGLSGTGARDVHLDFHAASELCHHHPIPSSIL